MRKLLLYILLSSTLIGCRRSSCIRDFTQYDTGEIKTTMQFEKHHNVDFSVGHKLEYFKNGQLKRMEWIVQSVPNIIVEFYEDGQLKSQEQFSGSDVSYGAYYTQEGSLTRTVGQQSTMRIKGVESIK